MKLVTRTSLKEMLEDERGHEYVQHVVGRACVALFGLQTRTEQASNHTEVLNMEGFSGPDARQGSLCAKYYLKHGKLLDWQLAQWTKIWRGNNMPRLCKYAKQLNAIAEAKAQRKAA